MFTSVPIKLSYGKEEKYDFLQNNLVLWEKKKVFLTKHQRKGNKNPVIFNLNSMWVERKIRPQKKHQPTKITEAVALYEWILVNRKTRLSSVQVGRTYPNPKCLAHIRTFGRIL